MYDVTDFLDDHPGGGESITISAGQDSSEEFNALHSDKARAMLEDYYIGDLDSSVAKPPVSTLLLLIVVRVPCSTVRSNRIYVESKKPTRRSALRSSGELLKLLCRPRNHGSVIFWGGLFSPLGGDQTTENVSNK